MKYFFLILMSLIVLDVNGQKTALESPYVHSVSYDESENKYIISWSQEAAIVANTSYFKILVNNPASSKEWFVLVDSFYNNPNLYIHEYKIEPVFSIPGKGITFNLNKDIVYFDIQACPKYNSTTYEKSDFKPVSNAASNIIVSATFDSACYFTITLNWNKYIGWSLTDKQSYEIEYKEEGGTYSKLDSAGTSKFKGNSVVIHCDSNITNPTIKRVDYKFKYKSGTKYYFQVTTYNMSSSKLPRCVSNLGVVNTDVPKRPTFIHASGTKISNDNQSISLKFDVDRTDYYKYEVFRSENPKTGFQSIGIFSDDPTDEEVTYVDNVDAIEKQYFYKVNELNTCGQKVRESGIESSIILKATTDRNTVKLSWTPYKGFEVDHYTLTRIRKGSIISNKIDASDTTATDQLDTIPEKGNNIVIEYEVKAVEKESEFSGNATSNRITYIVEQEIVMQGYFTPNGDGKNDEFCAPISFATKEYEFIIYNRWGKKVFESKDPSECWKGIDFPQGGYIYYLKVKGPSDIKPTEQRGSFVLIKK